MPTEISNLPPKITSQPPHIDDTRILHLRRSRLDLLPVLYELLRSESVTKAARSLDMTQSAVSQNLRHLRTIFNDDLLVPVGRSFRPTELASGLLEPLTRLLEDAESLVAPRTPFDPGNEEMHVIISSADYVISLLAPRLIRLFTQEAPKVTLEFAQGSTTTSLDDLSLIDFFIAPRAYGESFGKRMGRTSLWKDHIVCIAARSNTALPNIMGVDDLLRQRQVGYRVNPSIPERIRRTIHPAIVLDTDKICITPTFSVLGEIVEQSDCVALVPNRLAQDMMRNRDLRIIELPSVESEFEICAFWSLSASNKRGHAWVKQALIRLGKEFAAKTDKPYS